MTLKTLPLFFSFLFLSLLVHSQITINEINYRSITPEENIEFIELYNYSESEVSLGNWHLTNAVSFDFSDEIVIKPKSYLVISGNSDHFSSFYGVANVLGPWNGKLGNTGDVIELRNQDFVVIDKVNYNSWNEWPETNYKIKKKKKKTPEGRKFVPYIVEYSLQKINPTAPGKYAGSWRSSKPTPGKENTEVLIVDFSKTPIIKRVSRSSKSPVSGEEVEILVELSNISLVSEELEVSVVYQIVAPGNYISKSSKEYNSNDNWIKIKMTSLNSEKKITTFSGIIPNEIQKHRRLIRYKIQVKTNSLFNVFYPDKDHRESNYSYFVNDGQKDFEGVSFEDLSKLQSIELITSENQTNQYILSGTFEDYRGEGTLVYGGNVYDHICFRARGKNSRHSKVKRNLKFALNNNNPVFPKDDYGNKYDQPRSKIALSGGWINDCNSHGLTEALIYKTASLLGGFNKHTDYCQLRIIDSNEEGGLDGDFWGVYQIMEDWGGTMLAEHDLPDGNIYTYKDWTLSHQGENGPFGAENDEYNTWNEGIGDSKNGKSSDKKQEVSQDFLCQHLDFNYYFADLILNEITGNGETNYLGQHSYREYYNPKTKKWMVQCGDYDETFGSNHGKVSIYPRSESRPWRNMRGLLKREVLAHDSLKVEFSNLLRNTIDLLVNEEQISFLLKNESSLIYDDENSVNWTDLDYARWSGADSSKMNYDNYKKDVIDWYNDWFFVRADHLLNDSITYNNYRLGEEKTSPRQNIYFLEEALIPSTPFITYSGNASYPLDQLSFNCSEFIDKTGVFNAIEWRVGEWSDPENEFYNSENSPVYEVEKLWNSGELPLSVVNFTIPAEANLKKGRSYKIRARYKNNTNRWSHWSNPIYVIPTKAGKTETPQLVISEILFDPINECGVEFIKVTNISFFSADLNQVVFTDGVSYKFPKGSSLSGKGSLLLTKDSTAFLQKYGFSPFGEYKNSLDNNGEKISISGAYDQLINEVHYLKDDTWEVNKKGYSLVLKSRSTANLKGENWIFSEQICGSPSYGPESNYSLAYILVLLLFLVLLVLFIRRHKTRKKSIS